MSASRGCFACVPGKQLISGAAGEWRRASLQEESDLDTPGSAIFSTGRRIYFGAVNSSLLTVIDCT